jgi:hypothetical protein
MRSVQLRFGSDAELEASISWVRRTTPLNHTASVKKSQVHHALCETMTAVLAPLIRQ